MSTAASVCGVCRGSILSVNGGPWVHYGQIEHEHRATPYPPTSAGIRPGDKIVVDLRALERGTMTMHVVSLVTDETGTTRMTVAAGPPPEPEPPAVTEPAAWARLGYATERGAPTLHGMDAASMVEAMMVGRKTSVTPLIATQEREGSDAADGQ